MTHVSSEHLGLAAMSLSFALLGVNATRPSLVTLPIIAFSNWSHLGSQPHDSEMQDMSRIFSKQVWNKHTPSSEPCVPPPKHLSKLPILVSSRTGFYSPNSSPHLELPLGSHDSGCSTQAQILLQPLQAIPSPKESKIQLTVNWG